MIKERTFYKAKEEVNGQKSPFKYLFVVEIIDDTVRFMLTDEPAADSLMGKLAIVNMKIDKFEKIVEL